MGVAGEAALPSLDRANAKPTAVSFVEVEARALVPPRTLAEHAGPLITAHRGAILALHRSRRHDEAIQRMDQLIRQTAAVFGPASPEALEAAVGGARLCNELALLAMRSAPYSRDQGSEGEAGATSSGAEGGCRGALASPALLYLSYALQLPALTAVTCNNLALHYVGNSQPKSALRCLAAAQQNNAGEDDVSVHAALNTAAVLARLGRRSEAVAAARRAVELAVAERARLARRGGQVDSAQELVAAAHHQLEALLPDKPGRWARGGSARRGEGGVDPVEGKHEPVQRHPTLSTARPATAVRQPAARCSGGGAEARHSARPGVDESRPRTEQLLRQAHAMARRAEESCAARAAAAGARPQSAQHPVPSLPTRGWDGSQDQIGSGMTRGRGGADSVPSRSDAETKRRSATQQHQYDLKGRSVDPSQRETHRLVAGPRGFGQAQEPGTARAPAAASAGRLAPARGASSAPVNSSRTAEARRPSSGRDGAARGRVLTDAKIGELRSGSELGALSARARLAREYRDATPEERRALALSRDGSLLARAEQKQLRYNTASVPLIAPRFAISFSPDD